MMSCLACSGLDAVGDIDWGAHFCHLYQSREDLVDALVPFFAAGLANNEQCLWITSEPLHAADATRELARHVPDLASRIEVGQIQIVDHSAWYTRHAALDADSLLHGWIEAEQAALAGGYTGLRVTGNISFIKDGQAWCDFERYDARVTEALAGRRVIGLCSYDLSRSRASEVLDVVRNHQFAVVRRDGIWEVLENAAVVQTKNALRRLNAELEQRVSERTAQLAERERHVRDLLGSLPAAVYTTNADGQITYFNQAAIELTGRNPVLGSDSWCVSWRLYHADGRPIPHDECPMAIALRENRPVHGKEILVERPDGTRLPVLPYPTPLHDSEGRLIGAVNMLVDISERKRAEEQQRLLLNELNHRVKNTLAAVQSIAAQTFRGSEGDARAKDAFDGRLLALSKAHDLLTRKQWEGVSLDDLVLQELAPYAVEGQARFTITGPELRLRPKVAIALGMALHELATNAAKHGAFSAETGRVHVAWQRMAASDGPMLHLHWQEHGGPPVAPPRRKGFGSRLIERGLARELNGTVRLHFDPSGLACSFEVPLLSGGR